MKYVMLQHDTGLPLVLMCLAPTGHDQLAEPFLAQGYRVVSAGFARIDSLGTGFRAEGGSQSLRVHSHPDDSRVLTAMYRATINQIPPEDPSCSQS